MIDKKLLAMTLGSLLLSACSTYETYKPYVYGEHGLIHEKPPQYQLANETTALVLPPQLSSERINTFYEVPPLAHQALSQKLSLSPPGSVAAKSESKPALISKQTNADLSERPIHTAQDGHVIFVLSQPLSQAWLTVGQALPRAGFKVTRSNAEQHLYYVLDAERASPGISLLILEVTMLSDKSVKIWFHDPFNRALTRPDAAVMLGRVEQAIL